MKSVRLAVALCACLAPACNKSVAPVATPASAPSKSLTATPGGTAAPDSAAKAGEAFLTALSAGKATAAQLSPEFKKLVAPSAASIDWAAGHWLDDFKGDAKAVEKRTAYPLDATTTLVVGESGAVAPAKAFTYGKLVSKPGSPDALVDWLHVSPVRPAVDLTGDTAAKFVAVAFVDTLLTKQTPLAVSLLAPTALKRLAPPLDPDDEKLGYNRGILGIRLGNFRESFTSVTYGPATKAGANLTLAGELTEPGSERRKFVVTVAPAGSGWLVEDFRAD